MDFVLTRHQLAELIPGNKNIDDWHRALITIMPEYEINTPQRAAHFISQCAHESNNFRSLTENLNYSEKALYAVFGRYFGSHPKRNAASYARNPQKIANYVYQDEFRSARGALGNTEPGDGWRFCGRGLKQLTGRSNYTRFARTLGISAEEAAEYVATPQGAVESACWFWDTNKLNKIADTHDVTRMTKKINGGNIGLADRQERYAHAMQVFGNTIDQINDDGDDDFEIEDIGVLRKGSRGNGVAIMQEALGLHADGIFGPGTERSLKSWQRSRGLAPDGIAGPFTLEKLLG